MGDGSTGGVGLRIFFGLFGFFRFIWELVLGVERIGCEPDGRFRYELLFFRFPILFPCSIGYKASSWMQS